MIRQLQGNRRGGYGLVVLRIVWSSAWTRRSTRTFRSGEDQELDFLAGMWEMPRISRRRNKKRTRKMAHMVLVPACTPAFGPKLTAILPQAWCCSFDGAGEGHRT